MEIAFRSQTLRSLCESATLIKKKFGPEAGDVLMTLLSEIRAAECVNDLKDIVKIIDDENYSIRISVTEEMAVLAECNHNTPPLNNAGNMDWNKVYRLKIMEIENAK
jgi:hypothetical protein